MTFSLHLWGDNLAELPMDEAITGSKDSKDKETRILDAFRAWDKDKNGVITKDDGWDGDGDA